MKQSFELKFDPKTIEHLGVRMYSTLPPALAELISNSYDADSPSVTVTLSEKSGKPLAITVKDSGSGMTAEDIQNKFLIIGRNRRLEEGDKPSDKFNRLPTGKKGLGKLALFGLANKVTVDSVKDGKRSRLTLRWDELLRTPSGDSYRPVAELKNEKTNHRDGTIIHLTELKRKSKFDVPGLISSLSRIFIVDSTFEINVVSPDGISHRVTNEERYKGFEKQFEWNEKSLPLSEIMLEIECNGSYKKLKVTEIDGASKFLEIKMRFYSSKKPLSPSLGLRGISIFSRGKLVNSPEFFSESTSSHFFEYLTGIVEADFIDTLEEDVISTNRQSINWEHPKMNLFRKYLREVVKLLNKSWRELRKDAKEKEIGSKAGIDTKDWFSKLPDDIRRSAETIVGDLNSEEGVESSVKIIKALHNIVPEYPLLHWRHLHKKLKSRVEKYYQNELYGDAADQGARIYLEEVRKISKLSLDGNPLIDKAFSIKSPMINVDESEGQSSKNIREGQFYLSKGLVTGFWNPLHHEPIDTVIPKRFSELDCLNILSLISYLISRMDGLEEK